MLSVPVAVPESDGGFPPETEPETVGRASEPEGFPEAGVVGEELVPLPVGDGVGELGPVISPEPEMLPE